jgi:hypothetical protein
MTTFIVAACALACPLSMLAMMWMMRGGSRREKGRRDDG